MKIFKTQISMFSFILKFDLDLRIKEIIGVVFFGAANDTVLIVKSNYAGIHNKQTGNCMHAILLNRN